MPGVTKTNSMAKKTKKAESTEIPTGAAIKKEYFLDAASFHETEGETYAGLNILKLQPGQGAGPIEITKILKDQQLGKGSAARKRKPTDVYEGQLKGITIRLPVAASLVQKLRDAKVGVGDVIAIFRGEDYESAFKTRGASYLLKVISRAK